MFDNLGKKIEKWASINYWCGIIAFPILGVIIMSTLSVIWGICIIVVGVIVSIIQSYILAALGRIVTNTDILAGNTQHTIASSVQFENNNIVSNHGASNLTQAPQNATTGNSFTPDSKKVLESFSWENNRVHKNALEEQLSAGAINQLIADGVLEKSGEYYYRQNHQ